MPLQNGTKKEWKIEKNYISHAERFNKQNNSQYKNRKINSKWHVTAPKRKIREQKERKGKL